MIGAVVGWLDRRLPVSRLLERVLLDPVPERGGWWYTLGAALFLLVIIQVATGIFLMLYYVPSWAEARDSVIYIQEQVFLGWLVRGIHYWNMVMLIVLIGAHATRTFVSAAYKSPRELIWILGVLLLLLMLGVAFTGGILRGDQAGYFDAVVGTTIASWTPIVGGWISQLWRGGEDIGPATLTRTFALHVWLLPIGLLTVALTHITLLVLQGQFGSWVNYEPEPPDSPPYTEDQMISHLKLEKQVLDPNSQKVNLPVRTTWFYPNHIFREAVVTLGAFSLAFVAALLFRVPITGQVDPTTTTYAPTSMWFFLFQDQMLLLGPGSWLTPVVAVFLPGIVTGILILVPWLDRSSDIRPERRPQAIALWSILLGAVIVLSVLAASRVYNYDFINQPPRASSPSSTPQASQ